MKWAGMIGGYLIGAGAYGAYWRRANPQINFAAGYDAMTDSDKAAMWSGITTSVVCGVVGGVVGYHYGKKAK